MVHILMTLIYAKVCVIVLLHTQGGGPILIEFITTLD